MNIGVTFVERGCGMKVVFALMLAAALMPLVSVSAAGKEEKALTLQDALRDYRKEIVRVYGKYSRPEQKKIRTELMLVAKREFKDARKKATVKKMTISRHFDQLVDNIQEVRTTFRVIKDKQVKKVWLQDAARTFSEEVKKATDFKTKKYTQRWFTTFTEYMLRLRNTMRFSDELGKAIYPIVGQVFKTVLKEIPYTKTFGSADERYEENLKSIHAKFPAKSVQQKKLNLSLSKMMEQYALLLFRQETKAKK